MITMAVLLLLSRILQFASRCCNVAGSKQSHQRVTFTSRSSNCFKTSFQKGVPAEHKHSCKAWSSLAAASVIIMSSQD